MKAAGLITIEFVALNTTKKKLMEDFSDFFIKYGMVTMTNMNDQKTELVIHSHEFEFDEESDFDDEEHSEGHGT